MNKEIDFDLAKNTTFHVGGIAKNFYIPENETDVIELLKNELKDEKKIYVISAGSNLLINDQKKFEHVVSTKKIDETIKKIEDGKYYVGCSCRIQNVINTINKDGYGGFEELYSLPALFGGIVYMNAGIGGRNSQLFSISDFIEKVKVIDIKQKKIIYINKEECDFDYRHSVFQKDEYIILGAYINVEKQDIDISKERIEKRIKNCKEKQQHGKGCFGTCFSVSNAKLLKIVAMLFPKHGNVKFAKNNLNWFINVGNATYKDVMFLITKCKLIHKIFHKKIKCEVIIWE